MGRGVLTDIAVEAAGASYSRIGVLVEGGASYALARKSGNRLVLTLYDTRAASLDVRRVLDAGSLGGSVLRVLPSVEEDGRYRVVLTIELRDPARVRLTQSDGMLWLAFGDDVARATPL